jgi:hypothetical protein
MENKVFEGRLEFRIGDDASDTGLFLVRGQESFEILAVTTAARAPLGAVERTAGGLMAKVVGTVRASSVGAFIEATDIEVVANAATIATGNLGDALLSLYEATLDEPLSAEPPRRVGNMYFHPSHDGVVLEQVYIQSSSHGVAAALVDHHGGDVWFRTIDFSTATFQDSIRGPFKLWSR